MKARNDARAYGGVARMFHWSVALLILAAIGLGLYAANLPQGTQDQLQAIFAAFSLHKTVGVAVLVLAVLRILWTLTQTKPRPLHPQRRLEALVAEIVHWAMWVGMVIMPLTGWLLHSAAPGGFSRILWPLGQRLPLVPEDAHLAERFAAFHETGWWVLAALIVLHVAGAIKHAVIDRDGTLNRMAGPARLAPQPPHSENRILPHLLAALGAVLIWGATALLATPDPQKVAADPVSRAPATAAVAAQAAGWAVQQGTLSIEVIQGGNPIQGQFDDWSAQIDYDPDTRAGKVQVGIDIASLSLGSVSDSAKGPDFLNAPAHPQASFTGDILPPADGGPHIAKGQLTIAGKTVDAELPFDLTLAGDTATANGMIKVDRRDFGIGAGYADEATVGFTVAISFQLTATRQ